MAAKKNYSVKEIYETAKESGAKIEKTAPAKKYAKSTSAISARFRIDPSKKFQTIKGFGGAITESVGYVLSKLPEEEQKKLIASFYGSGKDSNRYTMARTHMNSCDFSLESWACVPQKDESLKSFSFERTDLYLTPALKKAKAACKNLSLMVTPWSPPAWMKTNGDMSHGGKLKAKYRELWARYFVKFLQGLKERGLNADWLTIQNESEASQPWDSCLWTGGEEGVFADTYLAPALKKAGFLKTRILVWDHNRDRIFTRLGESFRAAKNPACIAGAAFHWYSGDQYDNVRKCYEKWPDKEFIFTEGCIEGGPRPGRWFVGERYGHNIINDLNSGCTAWLDWNILLDEKGGPNHAGNFCDAPVLVDYKKKKALYQNSFYYIGHFSRFIKAGARRLAFEKEEFLTPATVDGRPGNMLEACFFENPDKSLVAVVMNRSEEEMRVAFNFDGSSAQDKKRKKVYIGVMQQGEERLTFAVPARSIQTYVFN